ncbi:MAG: D-2-hydroxyacid dehydrogenase [Caldisericia bacterium]
MKIVFDLNSNVPFYRMPSDIFAALVETLPDHKLLRVKHTDLSREIEDADIVVSYWLPPNIFKKAKNLKAIFYAIDGVGYEHLYPEILDSDVIVTNSGGCRSQAIAEHAFALMLSSSRQIVRSNGNMTAKDWWGNSLATEGFAPKEISGKTIAILGLGRVGKKIAKIAKLGFDMKTLGIKRTQEPVEFVDEVYSMSSLLDVLAKSNIVVCALPKTELTELSLNSRALSQINSVSIFVNISRGDLVDEEALISSIKAGRITNAGLDVFDTEPIDPNSPLLSMPQIITTPHSAGMTPEFWPRFARLVRENIIRMSNSETPTNIVDKQLGY